MIWNKAFLSRPCHILTAALVAALGLGLSQIAWGQTAATVPPHSNMSAAGTPVPGGVAATATAHDPAALASANWPKMAGSENGNNATHQGVKMHGRWVIDVRNPDGTLTAHREFENLLRVPLRAF